MASATASGNSSWIASLPVASRVARTLGISASASISARDFGGVSAFSNAVNDAFAHLGLTHTQMPHDHWRVWKTAQQLGLTAD